MTKKELEGMRYLVKEIEMLQRELDNLPLVSDVVTGSAAVFPYTKQRITVTGVDQQKASRLKAKITIRLDDLQDRLFDMESWMETIEDDEMRVILRMVYRNGLPHRQVADELGYTRASISKKLERFFSKSEE